ncbi:MarR family winged helix-turn-helix transcriptional regulator [Enterococcus timonensis]|uniref:MarR family winged helix-turn-helix transcriptional regulator n=1 Tax=Enterococcus timonensis TaxID=1852364 RepID=UPI0008D91EC6|nr:MarR family transcriptional regulator [Enterococcus timonensis]
MEHFTRYINRIARLSNLYRGEKLAPYHLNGQHHTYIINICRNPGLTQEQLAQMISVSKSNVTRQLAFLEKENYITRSVSPTDKRKMLVYPTEKALAIRPVIHEMLTDLNGQFLAEIPADQQELLLSQLKIILDKAQKIVSEQEANK